MPIRVCLIEDDAEIRSVLAGWLNKSPETEFICSYACAEEAIADLPNQSVQVVLTDINLPGMSGIECVRQLKLTVPKVDFLMLTAYMDADLIFQALAAGATGYLLKRTSGEELLAAIREVHVGGSPMSSSIARLVVNAFRKTLSKDEIEELSTREMEVLRLLARGLLYKEISEQLSVSFHTVHTLVRRIYDKLHVHTRRQAVERFNQKYGGKERTSQ